MSLASFRLSVECDMDVICRLSVELKNSGKLSSLMNLRTHKLKLYETDKVPPQSLICPPSPACIFLGEGKGCTHEGSR